MGPTPPSPATPAVPAPAHCPSGPASLPSCLPPAVAAADLEDREGADSWTVGSRPPPGQALPPNASRVGAFAAAAGRSASAFVEAFRSVVGNHRRCAKGPRGLAWGGLARMPALHGALRLRARQCLRTSAPAIQLSRCSPNCPSTYLPAARTTRAMAAARTERPDSLRRMRGAALAQQEQPPSAARWTPVATLPSTAPHCARRRGVGRAARRPAAGEVAERFFCCSPRPTLIAGCRHFGSGTVAAADAV